MNRECEERKNQNIQGSDSLVSIIVPVYGAEDYIEETIRCVEKQTFHNWELILVDDCGGDESLSVMQRVRESSACKDQIRIIQNERNMGAAESRNHGVREARGRYIAFLDADDLWLSTKLEEQLLFMRQKNVGFSFTSYEFGDAEGVPTGRVVHVPNRLDFRHALSRTVIFTSTVLFDTAIIPKELIHMPDMASEDTALWWSILKEGYTAYGMDRALTIYRRPASSLSSNKGAAVKRFWNLLREVAGCSVVSALFHLIGWAFHATVRRIWFRKISNHIDGWNRVVVLLSEFAEVIMAAVIYGIYWFRVYYPALERPRISRDGYNFGVGLKLYHRGHILVLAIYLVLMFIMMKAMQGDKAGEQKPGSRFLNQLLAMTLVNVITYFQLSLMKNWLMPVMPMVYITLWQALGSFIISYLTYSIYRGLFSAREMLLISGTEDVDSILSRFTTRSDMYYISRVVNTQAVAVHDIEKMAGEFGNVILWSVSEEEKSRLVKYCYAHGINVYLMPETEDVLVRGSGILHQFSTSIYLLRNHPMEIEQRMAKRLLDIILSILLIGVLSPMLLVIAIFVKCSGGTIFHGSERVTKNGKCFRMLKFRTVKEVCPDGTLRYIRGGQGLRRSHLDELPQLFNILKGDMSFIGPRPDRIKTYKERCSANPLYSCRTRVKAGLIGYTQVYGKYNSSAEERLNLDIEYIQNFSLLLDVKLFFFSFKCFTGADDERQV